jgi:GTP-binding protein
MNRPCFFLTSAPHLGALPQPLVPEAAFWGRSNVGKSSVLNALMGQTALARVSKRPGCTQAINFFHFSQGVHLADLPGYGFAQVPRSVQGRWEGLVPAYLEKRPNLRRIFLLLDSRHPAQPKDLVVLNWLASLGRPYSLILTKTDRISPSLLSVRQNDLSNLCAGVPIIPVSAKNRIGFDPIRLFLRGFDVQSENTPLPPHHHKEC